ncbi:MAG TPA: GAF domain-containing protein [Rubrobacter sp.]|nr:GAF domain-containing protein [Rubrobacter sp.]
MDVPSGTSGQADTRDLLRAFTAISKALNLAQPLPATLDLIAEKVSRTMGHKSCAVLLANRETGELLIEGSFGLGDEYVLALNTNLKQKITGDGPESRSVTAQAFRTGMPVYAPDITEDPRFAPWREAALREGYNSIVALPLVFRDEVIGVLNCYDEPREYTEDQVEALMVVAEQTASAVGIARLISAQRSTIEKLNSLNEHVTAQHALLQRSEKTHETLAALLLENRSLDDITNTLSDVLHTPVVLQDDRLQPLSSSDPEAYDGLPADKDLSDLDTTGRAGNIDAGDKKVLVAPVDLGGHERGYLSAPLVTGTQRTFALRTLEQGAVIFALYAIRERAARETEDRIKGDLLADLLANRFRDESEARERARHLGLDFSGAPLRVLVLGHEPLDAYLGRREMDARSVGPLRARLLSLARSFATGATPPGIAGLDGDHLVALLPCDPGKNAHSPAERLLRLIREDLPGLRARVAVSAPFTAPKDLAGLHKEAFSLLELADRLDAEEDVICQDDWKIYGLLLRSSDREDLLESAHKVLDPLLAQDRSADLLATLETYLDNDLSPTRTAAALYVHTNTVKYRLGKLADLMDLDSQTLSGALTLKVALMVRHLDPEGFDAAVATPD